MMCICFVVDVPLRYINFRVKDEITEVVGDKPSVEADDLDKLTYMNQVY